MKSKYFPQRYPIRTKSGSFGHLYIQPTNPKPPRWASFFRDYIDISQFGKISSPAAVFILTVRRKTFAIAFGQGRHLLNSGCWEDRFGIRVTLNSIGENRIRSIDKRTFDAISRHTREQASREATTQDFGLDIEQDLLRAVTGTPSDSSLGQRLSGMDALNALVSVEIDQLEELLWRYYEKFLDTSYQRSFPWVDQIVEVTDAPLRSELDLLLLDHIRSKDLKRCWLAVPEIIDWARVAGFRYGFSTRSPEYHDIHFQTFLKSLPDPTMIDRGTLSQRHVYCVGDEDTRLHIWPVYQCIYCEIDHKGDSFLLSGGKWYRVTRAFVDEVNEAFAKIPRFEHALPEYNDPSEFAYNQRVAQKDSNSFALMDQKNIQCGGSYNKIEFCDLYSAFKDIIHVKRYGSSSVLSHLFAQGLVSGELFLTNNDFRKKINALLPKTHRLSNPNDRPNPDQYRIVYAIISDSTEDLALPFFSRLNARHAVRRLSGYGYRVALAKIIVSDAMSKLKRYGKNKRNL